MTGLRTIWGVSLDRIEAEFGQTYSDYLHKQAQKFIDDKLLFIENGLLKPTKKRKVSDGWYSE
jgi:oxygen-independent coproporphyrinogen-3 oxidase